MIIYNNNREFIGIDEDNLKMLGYSNLAALLTEAADFADLFVKVPGHVHNFKHVHWIDFVLCATDKNSSKAIIHASGKTFSCMLDIKTIYLMSAPSKQSYQINLNNVRELSSQELQNISGELQTRPTPVAAPVAHHVEAVDEPEVESDEEPEIKTPTEASQSEYIEDEFDNNDIDIQAQDLLELETSEVEQDPYEVEDEYNLDVFEPSQEDLEKIGEAEVEESESEQSTKTTMTREDLHENLHEHVSIDEDLEEEAEEESKNEYIEDIVAEDSEDSEDEEEYVFNIQDTADALEMDVATIQDFVDDFIVQAKDFKPKLYEAVDDEDIIELKSLSHQLKGVAANLRIHDAQEILVKINKAEDFTNSIRDLDKFYIIISKLAGEEPEQQLQEPETKKTEDESFDEAVEIDDEKLEISEDTDDAPLEIDDTSLEINEDLDETPLEIDDEQLEISEDTDDAPLEIDNTSLEINEDLDETPLEIDDEQLEISEDTDDAPLEIDDTSLEINEENSYKIEDNGLELPEVEDNPLEIDSDFDALDSEQVELISNNEKNDLLNEVEDKKNIQKYDKMGVANEIGLDEDSFNELFEDYTNESKLLISQAQEGIDSDDPAKWQDAAKKLKGMSDNMRVTIFESDLEALITLQDGSNAQKLLDNINEALMSMIESKD